MNTIVYLTKHDGGMESRTFCEGNVSQNKEYVALMVKIATANPYKRVTIERVE